MRFFNQEHGKRAQQQDCACNQEHGCLMAAQHREEDKAQQGGDDLRHTDRAVKQTQISTHVFAGEGIGYNRQRIGNDTGPRNTD